MVRSLLALLVVAAPLVGTARSEEKTSPPPPGLDLRVYHIGNSLTRNVPLERLAKLFESAGGTYEYGRQLGGGLRLSQHLVKRGHPGPPGSGEYNTTAPYGEYDHALKNFDFDALVLQPYLEPLDEEPKSFEKWPYFRAGALQSASAFIDYARAKTEPGDDRWDRRHANADHVATDRFYVYVTWPKAEAILEQEGEKTYAAYWNAKYTGGPQPCGDFFAQLVTKLNERHPDLPVPVRMIPAGEVLARLDEKIRGGKLPGIEAFYERNQPYFVKSRRNGKGGTSPFDPDTFRPGAGVLNLYADGVHMNDQPHNGEDSGTIGS